MQRPRLRRGLSTIAIGAIMTAALTGCSAGAPPRAQSGPTGFTPAQLAAGDPSFRLGPDQVPSIAGLAAAQAGAFLTRRGFRVVVDRRTGCTSLVDVRLEPGPGAFADRGTAVTLHEAVTPPEADCAQAQHPDGTVLALLAWARGLGPRPRLAARLEAAFAVTASGTRITRSLRGADAADPGRWPGMRALADVLAAPVRTWRGPLPLVASRLDAVCTPVAGGRCPDAPGASLGGDPTATDDRRDTASLFDVTLHLDDRRRITAVTFVDHRPAPTPHLPDVVGDSAAYATARLRAFAHAVVRRDAAASCAG